MLGVDGWNEARFTFLLVEDPATNFKYYYYQLWCGQGVSPEIELKTLLNTHLLYCIYTSSPICVFAFLSGFGDVSLAFEVWLSVSLNLSCRVYFLLCQYPSHQMHFL